jgi:oligopeptide/dipeptide ABC transporter ATP-binding protein
MNAGPLLRAQGLSKSFALPGAGGRRRLLAVDTVDLSVDRGRTLAVVGESGCGKSTVGRLLLRLQEADAGRILLDGADVRALDRRGLRAMRRRMQVVFQDPYASLDPRQRVRDVLIRPMLLHRLCDRAEAVRRAAALMEQVGLVPSQLDLLPHEFSGGQRQRIAIARALSVRPDLIVCDEPVSALDVSVQANVINLLRDLQRDTGIALVFISHDLAVVRHLAHEVAVMYAGRVVEAGPAEAVFARPAHPYTRALLAAAPRTDRGARHHEPLGGEPPDLATPQPGCRFAQRCPYAQPACTTGTQPSLVPVAAAHAAACRRLDELPAASLPGAVASAGPIGIRLTAYRRAAQLVWADAP